MEWGSIRDSNREHDSGGTLCRTSRSSLSRWTKNISSNKNSLTKGLKTGVHEYWGKVDIYGEGWRVRFKWPLFSPQDPIFITFTNHDPFALSGISYLSPDSLDPMSYSAKLLNTYYVPCTKRKRQKWATRELWMASWEC